MRRSSPLCPRPGRASLSVAAPRRAPHRTANSEGLQWERWQRAGLEDLLGDMTPMELILRFTFSNPDLDTTIVGTANTAHLLDNVAILRKGPLPVETYTEAKRRLADGGSALGRWPSASRR